ncbi:MAG: iron-containing alcohol dehydrogenase [Bacillales bacterium]|nr:iron-containing alcohol dehydrogenase [Bacillales bacterium]
MLFDFIYYNPTKIYFGKNSLSYLKEELKKYGKKVLLAYGFSSIKKIGLYSEVIQILEDSGKEVFDFPGIMPNPTYKKMMEGAKIVKDNDIDLILAVGGGSVIDCAKAISVSAYSKDDPWNKYWIGRKEVDNKIVPVASILTLAATGSEANGGSVITNEELKKKKGRVFSPEVYPKFSILNPLYTYSLPLYQTMSGIFDIFSHFMEQYFSGEDDNVSDYLLEGAMRSLIHSTEAIMVNSEDYEARSNIMWLSTIALNTMLGVSKPQDWEVHAIGHQISAYTLCAHGMSLSSISPSYYLYTYKYGLEKFKRFAINVFNIQEEGKSSDEIAREGIETLKDYIKKYNMVSSIKELGVNEEMIPLIAKSTDKGGAYKTLTEEDIINILRDSYN